MKPGSITLVSTPIGNLSDLSPRGQDALRESAVVYAEDTRHTRKLFTHFGLQTPLRSLHAHNEAARIDEILRRVGDGEHVALVSDAGTPSVSDPGQRLVEAAALAGVRVSVIPGPSAVLAALAVSGFDTELFAFVGFPPRKGPERRRWIARLDGLAMTAVLFESPVRLPALLIDLRDAGLSHRACAVCRELTKVHEEVLRGTVDTLSDYYKDRAVRGEVTVVIASPDDAAGVGDEPELESTARKVAVRMAVAGMTTKEIARSLRDDLGLARNRAYEISLAAGESSD